MLTFYQKKLQGIFRDNALSDFYSLWNMPVSWYEAPNIRRGGWSGVSELFLNGKNNTHFFLKKQENHTSKRWYAPINGELTFRREIKTILLFQKYALPTLTPICYGIDEHTEKYRRAILVTQALKDYHTLDSLPKEWLKNRHERKKLLKNLAQLISRMHRYHFQHNCLYPKHILIKKIADNFDIRIIDLEKVKRVIFRQQAMYRDLDSLNRHLKNWSQTDRLRFFLTYRKYKKLGKKGKREIRILSNKASKKLYKSG